MSGARSFPHGWSSCFASCDIAAHTTRCDFAWTRANKWRQDYRERFSRRTGLSYSQECTLPKVLPIYLRLRVYSPKSARDWVSEGETASPLYRDRSEEICGRKRNEGSPPGALCRTLSREEGLYLPDPSDDESPRAGSGCPLSCHRRRP